jgi:hypothetical protein
MDFIFNPALLFVCEKEKKGFPPINYIWINRLCPLFEEIPAASLDHDFNSYTGSLPVFIY